MVDPSTYETGAALPPLMILTVPALTFTRQATHGVMGFQQGTELSRGVLRPAVGTDAPSRCRSAGGDGHGQGVADQRRLHVLSDGPTHQRREARSITVVKTGPALPGPQVGHVADVHLVALHR